MGQWVVSGSRGELSIGYSRRALLDGSIGIGPGFPLQCVEEWVLLTVGAPQNVEGTALRSRVSQTRRRFTQVEQVAQDAWNHPADEEQK